MIVEFIGRVGQRQSRGARSGVLHTSRERFQQGSRQAAAGSACSRERIPRGQSHDHDKSRGPKDFLPVAIIILCDNITDVPLVVREYVTSDGTSPFRKWLAGLALETRARVQARVFRFESGNLGDHKTVGDGVWEARLDFGPGYRVYFAKTGRTVILLLVGGDKRSQKKDINRAKHYWAQYVEDAKHGKT